LGYHKAENCRYMAADHLRSYQAMECNIYL